MKGMYTKISEEVLTCGKCSETGLVTDEGIYCATCNEVVIRLPEDVVDLLKTEETWGPCCDSLRSHVRSFIRTQYTKAHGCAVHC